MTNTNIRTIAVIDLETNGLPEEQQNTCAITELSIYAFPAKYIGEETTADKVPMLKPNEGMDGIENINNKGAPELPRVLHKLTMMINPQRDIHPISTKMSGLTNCMLSCEAPFDTNTANCLLLFLERLEKPVCLVAHNGWKFDYPIIRYVLAQINESIPSTIYCIDSFKAFRELDEKQKLIQSIKSSFFEQEQNYKLMLGLDEYRMVFSEPFQPKERFPKKGTYVLGNIYERIFKKPAGSMHRAEADVDILTRIIISYGLPFLAYAEERKQSFDKVLHLGMKQRLFCF